MDEDIWIRFRNIYLRYELPSMISSIVLGIIMLFLNGINFKAGWLHMKLTFAALFIVLDLLVGWEVLKGEGRKGFFATIHYLALFFLFLILLAVYVLKKKYCVVI